jgi:hypothetical protein
MQQIGKFAIVGQIGTGGFGVVYEGRDPFLKRRVAIKTCSSEEPEIRDRFFREAEIAGNLHHRNIVTVHDFGVQDGIPYLVQEYLSGEDLDRLIARREAVPASRRVDILLQAAQGLDYAHARGVIHRDIKPGNLRLTTEGLVKIMDFGIAKLANVASHLTRTGMTVGTAAYLPPEQIRGTAVDHRADIFSFGVTAYELLCYKRPFAGKTISALFWELLQRQPEPLSSHWPSCPPKLESLVWRCLAKEPDERYPSFAPIVAELQVLVAQVDRDETPTAPHRAVESGGTAPAVRSPAPPVGATVRPAAPAPTAGGTGRRLAPRVEPRDTAGLLGDVQEALTTARHAATSRRVKELLAAGNVEEAEREVAALPAAPGGETDALRRQVERARCDRLLVEAAASWGQGNPLGALEKLDQLLALDPGHQDALGLQATWRAEHEARERQRQAVALESEARRQAVAAAVARVEAPLGRGDVDAAEAALSAATADLGSHQPLRDLRRRIGEARQAGAAAGGGGRLLDQSTVGIDAARMAIARERAAAEAARRGAGAGGAAGPGGGFPNPPGVGGTPSGSPASWQASAPEMAPSSGGPYQRVPFEGAAELAPAWGGGLGAWASSPAFRLALVLGGLLLVAVLALGLWWVVSTLAATSPATPVPTATPGAGVGSPGNG